MEMFEAYGYEFPTRSSACRYRALVQILFKANVDLGARARMLSRFLEMHSGRILEKKAA